MADKNKFELFGIESLKIGATGADGVMGTVLTEYNDVLEGSISMDIVEPTENHIMTETSDDPYASKSQGSVKSFSFELLGLKLSQLPDFIGGTFTPGVGGTKDTYAYPTEEVDIEKSIEIVSKDGANESGTYQFVRCSLVTSQTGTLTKSEMRGLNIKCTILQSYAAGAKTTNRFILGETIPV